MTAPPSPTPAQLEEKLRSLRRWLNRNRKKTPTPSLLEGAEARLQKVRDLVALKEQVSGSPSRSALVEQYQVFIADKKGHLHQDDRSEPIADQAGAVAPEMSALDGYERRVVRVADLQPNAFNATIFVDSLGPEGIATLADDVSVKGGLVYPIQVAADGVTIVDGERRYRALLAKGIAEVEVVVRHDVETEDQIAEFVLTDHDTHRRASIREQVNLFEAWMERLTKGSRAENLNDPEARPRDVAAKRAGFTSYKIANKAKKVLAEAGAETVAKLISGELTISGAYEQFLKVRRIEKEGSAELSPALAAGEVKLDEAIENLDAEKAAEDNRDDQGTEGMDDELSAVAAEGGGAADGPERSLGKDVAEDAFPGLLDALCEHVAGTKEPLTTLLVRLATDRLQGLVEKGTDRG